MCQGEVFFVEEVNTRQGIATKMRLKCKKKNCTLNASRENFDTTPKIGRAYAINTALVLAMRVIGCGRRNALKFCSAMNMAKPVIQKYWVSKVATISCAAESKLTFN